MAYNVPLSSLNASDGNVTYADTSVLKVGTGGNVTVSSTLFEANSIVGIGTSNTIAWTGNAVIVYGKTAHRGNIFISNTTTISGLVFPDGTFQSTAGGGGGGTTISLSNDTTTNAPRYVNFTSATTGTVSTLYTSSPGLIYYPITSNLAVGGNVTVSGTLSATAKSFVIDHPVNANMKLVHGSLEGPEHGVYVRGKLSGTNKILLPDYWVALIDETTITVNVTPIGKYQKLYIDDINSREITVGIDSRSKQPRIECYYAVYAERRDVAKLQVEI